jgi:hypothetical protein
MINSIRLEPHGDKSTTAANTRVVINDQDIGVLYLNREEFNILHDILKAGANAPGSDVQVDIITPEEEEIDYDMFDDI